MNKTDEALKLAQEALELVRYPRNPPVEAAITAIKQARSAPVQEPTDVWFDKCFRSDPPAQPAPAVPAPLTDDVRGLLVIEHLGPNALLHKPMSIYEAFHMGIDAAEAAHGITGKGQSGPATLNTNSKENHDK
jgi:hypothetical protein